MNGNVRDRMAAGLEREEERLLTCVHCGFCLPACPTYVRLGDEADSPRGRLSLMRAVAEGRLSPESPAFHTHLDRCLGCRACEPVCPSGVPYGQLLERARAVARETRPAPLEVRGLLSLVASRARGSLVFGAARLLRAIGLAALAARTLPRRWALPAAMLAASRPTDLRQLPAGVPSRSRAPSAEPPTADSRPTVGLLRGCVQDVLFRRVNEATARVLRVNGYRVVEVGGQACCGALHAHAGDLGGARVLAHRNEEAFRAAGVDVVCVNAAGCGAMMHEYDELLAEEPSSPAPAHGGFGGHVRDVSELLAEVGPRPGAPVEVKVAYDPPCHLLHGQGVAEAPLRVLDAVPGLRRMPVEHAAECCGGAGTYGMTHPELGGRIGGDKVEALVASGADIVATGNPGCMMQIGGTMRLKGHALQVVHPVELLDESYRRAGLYDGPGRTR